MLNLKSTCHRGLAIAAAGCLAACQGAADDGAVTADNAQQFDAITAGETIRLTGNEPFWGGTITGATLSYTTPENMDGEVVQVERFDGLGGLGLSGRLEGQSLDIAITEEPCSDTMSDRTYPFSVILRIGDDTRQGCAWTAARPFKGPAAP